MDGGQPITDLEATAPVRVQVNGGYARIWIDSESAIYAKITAIVDPFTDSTGATVRAFRWRKQEPKEGGLFRDSDDKVEGLNASDTPPAWPAFAVSSPTSVAVNDIVRLYPGAMDTRTDRTLNYGIEWFFWLNGISGGSGGSGKLLRVTSSTPTSYGYPAYVQTIGGPTDTGPIVYVNDYNGGVFVQNQYVPAEFIATLGGNDIYAANGYSHLFGQTLPGGLVIPGAAGGGLLRSDKKTQYLGDGIKAAQSIRFGSSFEEWDVIKGKPDYRGAILSAFNRQDRLSPYSQAELIALSNYAGPTIGPDQTNPFWMQGTALATINCGSVNVNFNSQDTIPNNPISATNGGQVKPFGTGQYEAFQQIGPTGIPVWTGAATNCGINLLPDGIGFSDAFTFQGLERRWSGSPGLYSNPGGATGGSLTEFVQFGSISAHSYRAIISDALPYVFKKGLTQNVAIPNYYTLCFAGGIYVGLGAFNPVGAPLAHINDPSAPAVWANTTGETTLDSYTISNADVTLFKKYKVRARGIYSTILTPTLDFKVKIGGTTVADSGVITAGVGVSNQQWGVDVTVIVTATGASGSVDVQGEAFLCTAAGTRTTVAIVNTSLIGVDWTTNPALILTGKWGTASFSNTATLQQYDIAAEAVPISAAPTPEATMNYKQYQGRITAANTSPDGSTTTNLVLLVTGVANGTYIEDVNIKPTAPVTTPDIIRFYIYDGTNYDLIDEMTLPATLTSVQSPDAFAAPVIWIPKRRILLNSTTFKLYVGSHNGNVLRLQAGVNENP